MRFSNLTGIFTLFPPKTLEFENHTKNNNNNHAGSEGKKI